MNLRLCMCFCASFPVSDQLVPKWDTAVVCYSQTKMQIHGKNDHAFFIWCRQFFENTSTDLYSIENIEKKKLTNLTSVNIPCLHLRKLNIFTFFFVVVCKQREFASFWWLISLNVPLKTSNFHFKNSSHEILLAFHFFTPNNLSWSWTHFILFIYIYKQNIYICHQFATFCFEKDWIV